jgi:hypothetical protein
MAKRRLRINLVVDGCPPSGDCYGKTTRPSYGTGGLDVAISGLSSSAKDAD